MSDYQGRCFADALKDIDEGTRFLLLRCCCRLYRGFYTEVEFLYVVELNLSHLLTSRVSKAIEVFIDKMLPRHRVTATPYFILLI